MLYQPIRLSRATINKSFVQLSISLIKTMNASGPRSDHCGTPEVTSCLSDHLSFKTTLCFLPFNLRVPLISLSVSLLALFQMLCQNQGILYLLLLSNISVTFSKNSRRFVVQDLLLRNPSWVFFIKLLFIG